MRKHVLIVDGNSSYVKLFTNMGFAVFMDVGMLPICDLVCFTGGEDVSPSFYKEEKHPHTYSSRFRDVNEQLLFEQAVELDIPCVGICRGGQFLNVMNGGKMYQHVESHTQDHYIDVLDTEAPFNSVLATSTHHQMMRAGPSAVMLAKANLGGFKQYMEGGKVVFQEKDEDDTEVLFYPHTKCLCFQPHPEFSPSDDLAELFSYFVNKYCF